MAAHLEMGATHPPEEAPKVFAGSYFGQFHPHRQDRWVFNAPGAGFFLHRFAWTLIVRHVVVAGVCSADDLALQDYWLVRRAKNLSVDGRVTFRALFAQQVRCLRCQELLLAAEQPPQSPDWWREWLRGTRRALARTGCSRTRPAKIIATLRVPSVSWYISDADAPRDLLEPDAVKVAPQV
ncbi:hypothetical protein [Antrihabitans spumae]|uniref:Uncharacterized protein n=1 Tax=Antrihabitans spumae TaxID=3373370 RepID=A0ABW7KN29_9NOCA